MDEEELAFLPASGAIRRFERRSLSPVDLMEAVVARCRKFAGAINPFTVTYYDQALEDARQAESRYTRGEPRPLEGIPVLIKDLHPMAGEITTQGSRIFANHRDVRSHPCVERLLGAGAIVLARSTVPELGIDTVCSTPLWGTTRNPWRLDASPGASSAGAAAAVAAGLATLADGSDYGGSIRIPATYCGVFGYMPPFGRNPGMAPSNSDPFTHYGPLTRTVEDAALFQNVTSGVHPRDLCSLRDRVTIPRRLAGVRGWKIATSIDLGYVEVEPEIRENFLDVLAAFRDLGCVVEPIALGWTRDCLAAFEIHAAHRFAASIDPSLRARIEELPAVVQARLDLAGRLRPEDLRYAHGVMTGMYETLGPLLDRYDVLLCPSARFTSIAAEMPALDWGSVEIGGWRLPAMNDTNLCYPFNMLGQLPVASVPSGFSACGVPFGFQIVGRSYDDLGVFRAARAFERVRPWLHEPAARPRESAWMDDRG